jgi:hypothetical protein
MSGLLADARVACEVGGDEGQGGFDGGSDVVGRDLNIENVMAHVQNGSNSSRDNDFANRDVVEEEVDKGHDLSLPLLAVEQLFCVWVAKDPECEAVCVDYDDEPDRAGDDPDAAFDQPQARTRR